MEEAEDTSHVLDAMGSIGFDQLLFASDYPHWDFDDPVMAIPASLGAERRAMIFGGSARGAVPAGLSAVAN
jgi:predicted TIM-barrel fold metal-dependent hydrolase